MFAAWKSTCHFLSSEMIFIFSSSKCCSKMGQQMLERGKKWEEEKEEEEKTAKANCLLCSVGWKERVKSGRERKQRGKHLFQIHMLNLFRKKNLFLMFSFFFCVFHANIHIQDCLHWSFAMLHPAYTTYKQCLLVNTFVTVSDTG